VPSFGFIARSANRQRMFSSSPAIHRSLSWD
jgi:hypothetical protein